MLKVINKHLQCWQKCPIIILLFILVKAWYNFSLSRRKKVLIEIVSL